MLLQANEHQNLPENHQKLQHTWSRFSLTALTKPLNSAVGRMDGEGFLEEMMELNFKTWTARCQAKGQGGISKWCSRSWRSTGRSVRWGAMGAPREALGWCESRVGSRKQEEKGTLETDKTRPWGCAPTCKDKWHVSFLWKSPTEPPNPCQSPGLDYSWALIG